MASFRFVKRYRAWYIPQPASASSLPEIVRHGAEGLLVPPRDPGALADALVTLGRDGEMRARMAAAGIARIRAHFSLDSMIDRYETVLREVAER